MAIAVFRAPRSSGWGWCRCRCRRRSPSPPAQSRARVSWLWRASARAAAIANGPPDPTATMPSSGSIRSPVPESRKVDFRSATIIIASSRRSRRSVRQSRASSTADRSRLPRYCSSFDSNREKSAKESAADPANPARIDSLYSRRILRAPCLSTVLPNVTWPSPARQVRSWCRTARIVVEWITLAVCTGCRGQGRRTVAEDTSACCPGSTGCFSRNS